MQRIFFLCLFLVGCLLCSRSSDNVLAAEQEALSADQQYERMLKKWDASVRAEDQREAARLQEKEENIKRMMQLEEPQAKIKEQQDAPQPEKKEASPYVRVEGSEQDEKALVAESKHQTKKDDQRENSVNKY